MWSLTSLRAKTHQRPIETENSANQAPLRGAVPRDYVHGIADRVTLEFCMKRLSRIAAVAAVALVSLPACAALAQNTPNAGTETPGTAAPAPAAAPAATTTPTAATPATTTAEPAKGSKKKKAAKMTRQQEIDKSVNSGTVPGRYRNSVPKQYQQYIPFEKQ
jgi:hypothetical protein